MAEDASTARILSRAARQRPKPLPSWYLANLNKNAPVAQASAPSVGRTKPPSHEGVAQISDNWGRLFQETGQSLAELQPQAKLIADFVSMQPSRAMIAAIRHSLQFHLQLSRLSLFGLKMHHVGYALQFWHRICAGCYPPEPIIDVTVDGALQFAWSDRSACLDLQIYEDGALEWFYHNRLNGVARGTENDRELALPTEFIEHVKEFAGRHGR